MQEYLNHTCSICGLKYHACDDCKDTKSFTPWRSIVDSIEHYKIYLIIRDYNNNYIDKLQAKYQLSNRDLEGLENFVPEIRLKIEEIIKEENNAKKASRRK